MRAIELDESGDIVPGWPADGVPVCGSQYSYDLSDAMVNRGQLFVALGAAGAVTDGPKIQRLSRAVLSAPTDLPASALELAPPAPNPARGAWLVRLALRSDAAVSLEAFDVAGRRALAADLGPLSAGRHVLEVPGGASLAPGIYRIRARAGGLTAERVLVKVR